MAGCLPSRSIAKLGRIEPYRRPTIDASSLRSGYIIGKRGILLGIAFFFNSRSFVDRHLSPPFETRRLERPLRTSSGSRQTGLSVLSLAPWSLGVGCNKGGTRGRSNLEKGRPDFWSGAGEREKDKSLDALNTGGGNWISVIMCIYDGLLPSAMLWERRRERIYDMFIYVVRRGK